MARHSYRHRVPAVAPGALRHARSLQHKTTTPYRVVYEQVTEKKKKLIKEVAFSQKAPRGYTFIPAGDPQITNRCKEIAREDGEKVFIVTTSKPRAKQNRKGRAQSAHLAHEVHRVGYHFPSLVVGKACMSLGISLSQSGQVVFKGRLPAGDMGPHTSDASRINGNNHGLQDKPAETEESQAALDAQARETIKDLFPKIPDKDLQNIVRQAFKKNTNRVGTAVELPLPRRVQLAVVAHIRHVYTNYDRLLRVVSYQEARARVEKPCLDLLAQWRSDDDDDADAMEDILREVIVIDDDDDAGDDPEDNVEASSRINRNDRDASIEIISSRTFGTGAATRDVDHITFEKILPPRPQGSPIFNSRDSSRNARERRPPFTHRLPDDHNRVDRNGIYHDRWKEALHRRRLHQEPGLTIQQDPVRQDGSDNRRYSQPRDDAGFQMLALNRIHSYADQAMGTINRRPRGRFDDPGQVVLPAHHHGTLAFESRPVKYMVSHRETEGNHVYADYNQLVKPPIVPLGETRRLMNQPSNERESWKDTHDPRIYFLPRQAERVLPSVEGASHHREELLNENDEVKKFEQLRRERQKPPSINLGGKMGVLSNQSYRAGDRILLPTENLWEPSPDFHEEIIRQDSHQNERSVSHHNHASSMHTPGQIVNRSLLLGPAEARGYSGVLRSAQYPALTIDGIRQASQEGLDEQVYSAYNEQRQAPQGPSSLLGQRHVLHKPAYVAVESSRPIPDFHYSQGQLPVFYGSSSPYDFAHQDGAKLRYEPLNTSRISTLRFSDRRTLEASPGRQHRFSDPTISPEHNRLYAGDVYGRFEGSRQAYQTSRIDGTGTHTPERPEKSIFLRKVGDNRYSKSKQERLRPSEPESRLPHERPRITQYHHPEVFHEIPNERDKRIPIVDTLKRDNISWVKDEYRQMATSYDQADRSSPYHGAEWYRRRETPHTSTNLEGIRTYPEEIIVID